MRQPPESTVEIQDLHGGNWRLRNRASGLCLDSDGAGVNGGAVRMWECVSHPHQTWRRDGPVDESSQSGASRTQTFGGPGGGSFELACPEGSFMTGVRARSGSWIDALSPVCSRWVRSSATLGEIGDQAFTGGGGGGESFIRCEGRRGVIVSLDMFQANNDDGSIGHITVNCGDFKQPWEFWNKLGGSADFLGNSQRGPRVEERCGTGLVAAESMASRRLHRPAGCCAGNRCSRARRCVNGSPSANRTTTSTPRPMHGQISDLPAPGFGSVCRLAISRGLPPGWA